MIQIYLQHGWDRQQNIQGGCTASAGAALARTHRDGKAMETEARTRASEWAAPDPGALPAHATKSKPSPAATGPAVEPLTHGALRSGAAAGLLQTTRRQMEAFEHTRGKHSPRKRHRLPPSSQRQESARSERDSQESLSQPAKNAGKEAVPLQSIARCLPALLSPDLMGIS